MEKLNLLILVMLCISLSLNENPNYKIKWVKGKTEIFGTDCVLPPELKYKFYSLNNHEYIKYGTEIDFYSIGIMGCEIIYNIFDHAYQHSNGYNYYNLISLQMVLNLDYH